MLERYSSIFLVVDDFYWFEVNRLNIKLSVFWILDSISRFFCLIDIKFVI